MNDKNLWKNNMEFEKKIGDKIKNAINLCQYNLRLKMAMFRVSNYIY